MRFVLCARPASCFIVAGPSESEAWASRPPQCGRGSRRRWRKHGETDLSRGVTAAPTLDPRLIALLTGSTRVAQDSCWLRSSFKELEGSRASGTACSPLINALQLISLVVTGPCRGCSSTRGQSPHVTFVEASCALCVVYSLRSQPLLSSVHQRALSSRSRKDPSLSYSPFLIRPPAPAAVSRRLHCLLDVEPRCRAVSSPDATECAHSTGPTCLPAGDMLDCAFIHARLCHPTPLGGNVQPRPDASPAWRELVRRPARKFSDTTEGSLPCTLHRRA